MKLKRFSIVFALVIVLSTLFSSFAFADETTSTAKANLVALGDSISFGYKLEANQTQASPNAFPNLIGDGKFNVTNLGVPGWTSTQLLAALDTEQFTTAVKAANVITLQIGNNDLLQAADLAGIIKNHTPVDPAVLQPKVQAAAAQFGVNLQAIVTKIKNTNPAAPIILYNLYDPFGESTDQFNAYLHTIGEQIVTSVNTNIISALAKVPGVYLADAYTKFNGHQSEYISPAVDLIHPNLAGHQALAALASDILASLQPKEDLSLVLTASTTEQTSGPLTITVKTNAQDVASLKWLPGIKKAADFTGSGNDIKDNKFDVNENGKYTVLILDSKGQVKTETIEITNIKVITQPAPKPQPAPSPAPTHAPQTNTGGTGHALPDTATPVYNYILAGLGLVLVGLGAMKFQTSRRENL